MTQPPLPQDPTPGTRPDPRAVRRARTRRMIAGAVGVAALGTAGVVGINVATAADSPTPSATSTTAPDTGSGAASGNAKKGDGPRGGHGRGGLAAFPGSTAALATKLGVTEDALKTAIGTVRDEIRAERSARADDTEKPAPGERPDADARQEKLATALAKALDLDAAKVTAALTELRTEAQAERATEFSDKLDQAVEDGTLTRAEADAVLKAAKEGVIGMGRGGRGPR